MNFLLSILLIVLGIACIRFNSLSKRNNGYDCNVCGARTFGRKCIKCGYVNYEHDEIKGNFSLYLIGLLLIVGGILLFYKLDNFNNDENINTINNDINTVKDNKNEMTNNVNNSLNEKTNTNKKDEVKPVSYIVVTDVENRSSNVCNIDSFTGTMKELGFDRLKFEYTITFTDTRNEDSNTGRILTRLCSYKIYLYAEDNKLIKSWNEIISSVVPGKQQTKNNYSLIDKDGTEYRATIE